MGGENEPLPLALENFVACQKGRDSATGGSTCILPSGDRPLGGPDVVRSLVPPPWWGRGKGSASPGPTETSKDSADQFLWSGPVCRRAGS